MTRQRRVVLEELKKLKTHPSAEDLYSIVREKMPTISLGTVYRNLDLLWRNGQILKLDMAGGQCRYDGDVSPHYHVRCMECGIIEDLTPDMVRGVDEPVVLKSGFKVEGWRLEFSGLCPACNLASLLAD